MKCPNCSGTLYFDIDKQKLVCEHCSAEFSVSEYSGNNDAQEGVFEGEKLYICKNCGAELISMNDEAVTYCSYCGSEAILQSEISGMRYPKKILPFRINKKQCKDIYMKEMKGKWYVPKEFKDPEFIEKFRPFYIPYWMYQVQFRKEPFSLKGSRSYYSRGYDFYEEYDVTAAIRYQGMYGIPYDASRNFDDGIAENIAPFQRKLLVNFAPGYLAGMYADKPNVDADLYEEEVLERATDAAIADIDKDFRDITLHWPRKKDQQKFLETHYTGVDAVFLPVWFLTWRKDDRVAYAVVNGQTGKIHIDLPADMRLFMFMTVLGAAVLFALLTMFVTVTSRFVIWFSVLLAYMTGRRYLSELREIRDRENHVFDKGYLLSDEDDLVMSEKKRAKFRKKGTSSGSGILRVIGGILGFLFIFALFGGLYDELVTEEGALAMTFIILIPEIILFLKTVNTARYLRNKSAIFTALLTLGAVVYSFTIAAAQPVQDWWYYLGSLISLAAASVMCTDLIRRYNETSTRPLPSFYSRKGGNDHA